MAFTFGSNNNNNTSSFGAFGSNNTPSGFGQSSNSPFGGNNSSNNNTSGGFGASSSTFGGFGSNNTSSGLFGNKPASTFGTNNNTSGGLFGGNANTSTGGFGGNTSAFGSNTNATGLFGASNTGGGFGGFGSNNANTTPFGGATNTPKPLFGAGGTGTTGGFGSPTSAFGSSTALNGGPGECPGTAGTVFSPFTEKEANGQTSTYQNITLMQPYQKFSQEELRLADYSAGRRFGTGTGGTGAFGMSNFGGGSAFGANTNTNAFGSNANTGGGLFGNTNTTTNAFGGTANNTFGANNSSAGGLFGGAAAANKPSGLFGSTSTPTTGGLFGSNNATPSSSGGLFGAANQNNSGSGGLFGNNNAAKPGGLFGSTNNTSNTGTGFSFGNNNANNANTGGLFGSNTATANANTGGGAGGLFGGNTGNTSGGLFGNNNQNKPAGGLFGGGGAFGAANTNNASSGGLFGNANANNASGGLFGSTATPSTNTGGLFGNNSNANANTGGLFGNNQQKPGGLFGNTNTNASTGTGLFGGSTLNNASNTAGGGLFGNNAANATNTGGLFNSGGSLFGNNQQATGGLFGSGASTNNNNQGGLFGQSGGLFGQSQNQQQNQQEQFKISSLNDPNPYGQSSIWTGLPAPTQDNSKPLFTPLVATQKLKESAQKPLQPLRLNQSRYMTPPRRNGFGLSYSTYGTPSSAASTPGGANLNASMYGSRNMNGGSFGRSFSRSASVQNLRSTYGDEANDLWRTNTFGSGHRHSGGSIKRLTIDRSIRQDLFARPSQLALPAPQQDNGTEKLASEATQTNGDPTAEPSRKLNKRVSFENDQRETNLNGDTGALVRTGTDSDREDSPPRNKNKSTNESRNGELASVPEDQEAHQTTSRGNKLQAKPDPTPGDYWMKPTRVEIAKMPRAQAQNFKGFQVGRHNCGYVTFDGAVDLTKLDLDSLYENIVEIRLRSITVYPDAAQKPPPGRGLNVPSSLYIENSWPRKGGKPSPEASGPLYEKHIKRLKAMGGTTFKNYDSKTGVWTFTVEHYTRYGLDYDDDEDELSMMDQSELHPPPSSIHKSADVSLMEIDDEHDNAFERDAKKDSLRSKKSIPGGFDRHSIIDEGPEISSDAPSPESTNGSDQSEYSEPADEIVSEDETSSMMPGALPSAPVFESPVRRVVRTLQPPGTPGRPLLDLEGDWADQLQRTISPRKQDRNVLRDFQSKILLDKNFSPMRPKTTNTAPISSNIDLMNTMFPTESNKRQHKTNEFDFEFPYAKRAKTFQSEHESMSELDRRWHDTFKTSFTPDGGFVYRSVAGRKNDGHHASKTLIKDGKESILMEHLTSAKLFDLKTVLNTCVVGVEDSIPLISYQAVPFPQLKGDGSTRYLYDLAHVLFDDYDDEYTLGLTRPQRKKYASRIKRDRFARWIEQEVTKKYMANVQELEKSDRTTAAILHLTAHKVGKACDLLLAEGNHRLCLLVARLDSADQHFMDDIKQQLDAWREQNVLSEITEEIRTVYEICAGNVTISKGKSGANVPPEDKASTFSISEKHNLSWLQCFSLGLFYGRGEKNNADSISRIEDAVREYQGRLDRSEETAQPEDDPVWTMLRLYASQQPDTKKTVQIPSIPAELSGLSTVFDRGVLFTFANALTSNIAALKLDVEATDLLVLSLAHDLAAAHDIAGSAFVLLHLSNPVSRKEHVLSLLHTFAAHLTAPEEGPSGSDSALWKTLTTHLRLPATWLYGVKASFAASSAGGQNSASELRYLIRAEQWLQAHDCFVKRVAPAFVIDEDWLSLIDACRLFGDDPSQHVSNWSIHGGLYNDFARLMTNAIARQDSVKVATIRNRLVKLGKSGRDHSTITTIKLGQLSRHELEEHVAIKEMANTLARMSVEGGKVGTTEELLEMPVTSDVRLRLENGMLGPTTMSTTGKQNKASGVQADADADIDMDVDADVDMRDINRKTTATKNTTAERARRTGTA